MNATDTPVDKKPLAQCSVDEFIKALASAAVLPGAGAAGGVALALAAACAGKAVAITRRHDEGNTLLAYLQTQLADLAASALILAENDALHFRRQLESADPAAASALLHTDLTVLDTCAALDSLLDNNARYIAENMRGDWEAAKALNHACRIIHEGNVQELRERT